MSNPNTSVSGTEARSQPGSAFIACPDCGTKLFRSGSHREQAVPYTCKCGFHGP